MGENRDSRHNKLLATAVDGGKPLGYTCALLTIPNGDVVLVSSLLARHLQYRRSRLLGGNSLNPYQQPHHMSAFLYSYAFCASKPKNGTTFSTSFHQLTLPTSPSSLYPTTPLYPAFASPYIRISATFMVIEPEQAFALAILSTLRALLAGGPRTLISASASLCRYSEPTPSGVPIPNPDLSRSFL